MRKPVLLLVITVITVALLTLASCGDESSADPSQFAVVATPDTREVQWVPESPAADDPQQPDDPVTDDEPHTPQVFFFKIGDVVIDLNQDVSYVISNVGDPVGVLELPSCAFDGMDRVFRYPGADLYTYPAGDNDIVYTIVFYDDSIRTAEGGIRLGSTLQDVLDAYGDDFELDSGMYTFTRGLTTLEFFIDNDIVMGITYAYLVNQ